MDVQPVGKFEWLDLVFRLKIPTRRLAVATALARFARPDGSNVFPSQQKVADMAKLHETNARGHIRALCEMGLLTRTHRGGGRGGATSTYRLTRPADVSTLPIWLDADMNRLPQEGPDAEIHRALGLGVSVDNSEPDPVDNPETPSADARYSDAPDARADEKYRALALETPSGTARNTERWRYPNSHEYIMNSQDPAWSPKATQSLAHDSPPHRETINGVQVPSDDEFEAARAILATMPRTVVDRWRHAAERELAAAGIPLDRRAVAIRAADLATRPNGGP